MKKTITEMAERYDLTPETIRKWERDYDLKVPRNDENHRYYREQEVEVFDYIVQLKHQGMMKKAIIKALNMSDAVTEQKEQAADLVPLEHMTGEEIKEIIRTAAERHEVALADKFTNIMTEALEEQERRYMDRLEALEDAYSERLDQIDDRHTKALDDLVNAQQSFMEELKEERPGILARLFGKKG